MIMSLFLLLTAHCPPRGVTLAALPASSPLVFGDRLSGGTTGEPWEDKLYFKRILCIYLFREKSQFDLTNVSVVWPLWFHRICCSCEMWWKVCLAQTAHSPLHTPHQPPRWDVHGLWLVKYCCLLIGKTTMTLNIAHLLQRHPVKVDKEPCRDNS